MCDPVSAIAIGAAVTAAGSLYSGVSSYQAGQDAARQQTETARFEMLLGAVEDDRTRARLRGRAGEMRAQLAGRGVQLDSPSSIALAETAARELSFASQSARSGAAARAGELSAAARQSRALARQGLVKGVSNAAGALITASPKVWPSLGQPAAAEPGAG